MKYSGSDGIFWDKEGLISSYVLVQANVLVLYIFKNYFASS